MIVASIVHSIAKMANIGMDVDSEEHVHHKLPLWRAILLVVMRPLMRIMLLLMGVVWIRQHAVNTFRENLVQTLTQSVNFVTVYKLPVYSSSTLGIQDPVRFATNFQTLLASVLSQDVRTR